MDDTWQLKCTSALQSLASHEVDLSSGQRFVYPTYVGQELRSQLLGRMSNDSVISNVPGFSSYSVGHSEAGNSFQALLSGPASLLHGDFQEFSNKKPSNSLYKLPGEFGGIFASKTAGSRVPYVSTQNGLNFCASKSLNGSSSGLQHGLPASSINLQRSGMAMADILPVVSANESIKDYTLPRGECRNTMSVGSVKLQNVNMPLPQKMLLEAEVPKHSSPLIGCPRVSCMGISGDLLLSNTGLLGILCSCHYFHMSVFKFCEHSGLRNVNAGDAVHMDSGETIAQWRKLYFQKFGIRVPEDQSGWDWPEGLSLTANLVKFGASIPVSASNISRKPDRNHDTEPSEVSERPVDNFFPRNPVSNQNSDDTLHNRRENNQQDRDKFLVKDCPVNLQRSSCVERNNNLVHSPSPMCSTMPKFSVQGPEIGSQFLSGNIYGIAKSGTLPTPYPSPQNLRIPVKSPDVCKTVKAKDTVVLDKDVSASNIELRLGQPYHPSMSSGNPILSSIGPWVQSRLLDPRKPFSVDQRTHKVAISKQEEVRQDLPHSAGLFNSSARSKEHLEQHFLYRNCSVKLAIDSSDKEKADMSKNPVVSLCKQFNTSPDGYVPLNVTNINQQVLPEALHCASHIVKGNSVDIARNASSSLERHHDLVFLSSVDKGKSVRCNASSICPEPVSLSKSHNCRENPSSFTGFPSRNSHSEFPFMHNNGWLHFSNVQKASDPGKFSHCKEKVPCVGNSGLSNPVVFKSVASATASQILPPQPVRTGLSSPCAELTPALLEQESISSSPYLLDDNLRLIALRQILELSKQQQVMSCSEKNLEQWRCGNSSDADLIHAVVESSKSGEQRLVSKVTHREDLLEFSARSIQAYPFSRKASNDLHQCSSVSGLDNCSDLSTWSQGMPHDRKEDILQHQLPHDPLPFKQPSLVIGRNGEGIASANEHGSCCHKTFYIQGTCGCIAHAKCLGDQCHLRNESPPNPIREPIGSICVETSPLIGSQLNKDCIVLKENTTSANQCRNLNSDIAMGISCHASRWKDVPSKVKRICNTNNSTVVLSERRDELTQLGDTAAKCSNGLVKVAELLGEKEMSNVSSGCSTPAVTQASIVSKNIEVSTVLAGNTVCINDNLGDEGSGIDKCGSSDNACESDQSNGFYGLICKTSLRTDRSFEVSNNQPCTLLDEVKRMNSLTRRKGQHQVHNCAACDGTGDGKTGVSEELEMGMKTGKRRRELKLRTVDVSLSEEGSISCDNTAERPCLSKHEHAPKRVKSKSSSVKPLPRKRDLLRLYRETDKENAHKNEIDDTSLPNQSPGISSSKKLRSTVISDACTQFQAQQKIKITGEDDVNYNSSVSYTKTDCHQVNLHCRKARPIVCGKFGEIINGKPANIVSLDKVLKNAKRCTLPKKSKSRLSTWREGKRTNFRWSDACFDKFSNVKKTKENCDSYALGSDDMALCTSVKERTKASSRVDRLFGDESLLLLDQIDVIVGKDNAHAQSKPKIKEIRKRSLYELTSKGKNSESLLDKKILNTAEREFEKSLKIDEAVGRSCKNDAKRCDQDKRHQSVKDSFSFCCVCGSSNEDESNCLLECGQCLIKIHQACYGVPKVPKGLWCCRPCRTNSSDIACVLCGYGGGAMTRALRSQTIVKGLLKAWSLEEESSCPETLHDKFNMVYSLSSGLKNSITAGVHDSTVKQWVHMVCGLWTPGTRCPNVDTMSAFDVSDASHPWASVVCSICDRPGGTCIQCRVMNCSVQFHPWCAHQKGLLQSEVEGVDNENVGFYGRCVLHATYPTNNTSSDATCTGTEYSGQRVESCARSEGYKGRKRDGFWHNLNDRSKGQCLVPQEQLNAWNHINGIGQKSCIQGLPKLPASDMDYDCRKEYNRYKQAKGWKRLVVYKSGIHALGLYTSQFISRGEMVVEYVGEIVGIRVADKREVEYQSGRKLQYKSACYFFRIDMEHIIDATCKGGIARFVNHSCLPNCVAKVISVRNEKKVVFFADRDIYPGEEITYDYHFNHEDEGKKIPCFCNSKNCRRYLN